MSETTDVSAQNKVKLVFAWAFVGIPLIWGVSQTLANAMQLFQ
ncbi:hypothetical protein V6C03_03075 [Methyloligella sp. 2.7D]|nr:hypothetical protein [Methyloligella sp. GL2]